MPMASPSSQREAALAFAGDANEFTATWCTIGPVPDVRIAAKATS
jgi:hypothetical protein